MVTRMRLVKQRDADRVVGGPGGCVQLWRRTCTVGTAVCMEGTKFSTLHHPPPCMHAETSWIFECYGNPENQNPDTASWVSRGASGTPMGCQRMATSGARQGSSGGEMKMK